MNNSDRCGQRANIQAEPEQTAQNMSKRLLLLAFFGVYPALHIQNQIKSHNIRQKLATD